MVTIGLGVVGRYEPLPFPFKGDVLPLGQARFADPGAMTQHHQRQQAHGGQLGTVCRQALHQVGQLMRSKGAGLWPNGRINEVRKHHLGQRVNAEHFQLGRPLEGSLQQTERLPGVGQAMDFLHRPDQALIQGVMLDLLQVERAHTRHQLAGHQ